MARLTGISRYFMFLLHSNNGQGHERGHRMAGLVDGMLVPCP